MGDENKRLSIAYVTANYPWDRRAWSGTTYYMAQALQKYCGEVHYIAPIRSNEKRLGKIIHESSRFFLKKNFAYGYSIFVAKKHAKIAAHLLAGRSFDVIFSPIGETEIAFLQTDIPIVLALDTTFALAHDYNPIFSNLLNRSAREADIIENLAYRKASVLLFSSAWAARSAVEDYHAEQEKVCVVPFGANLDYIPPQEIAQTKKKSDHCRLLFIGTSWQAKGGDIAFETLLKLEEMGVLAELIVCGSTPPQGVAHERMTVIPFLDKSDERQHRALEKLYAIADFLLVPTRNDCTPIAFSEASAFALPVITTRTGGIPEVVRDGENGFVLPYGARGAEYAEVIAGLYRDDQRYTELVRTSRAAFEDKLNWDAWGLALKDILSKLVPSR
jgi:glycosyltransferase involved in cell wall biosynthesis